MTAHVTSNTSPQSAIDLSAPKPGTGLGAKVAARKSKAPGKATVRTRTMLEHCYDQTMENVFNHVELLERVEGLIGGTDGNLAFLKELAKSPRPARQESPTVQVFTEAMKTLLHGSGEPMLGFIAENTVLHHVSSWIRVINLASDHLPAAFVHGDLVSNYTEWAGLDGTDLDALQISEHSSSAIVSIHSILLSEVTLGRLIQEFSENLIDPATYRNQEFVQYVYDTWKGDPNNP